LRSLLITGGCGFIGTNLVQRVVETSSDHVVVVDKLTYASSTLALNTVLRHPRVTLVRGDIADETLVARLFDDHQPAAVVNLAAETHVDRSIDSAQPFIDTNVRGTLVLLEASRRFVAQLAPAARSAFRFLQVSTDEVFGSLGPAGRFTESTPYAPNSPYAASKAAADHLVRAFGATYGLAVLITNCSNNYGPFQHPEKLIPLMILNALEARPLPIYGDGGNVRDWLHVQDHCAAILRVLESGRPGESYNVGAENERSNVQIVAQLCDTLQDVSPAERNGAMRAAGLGSYHALKRFVSDRPGHDRRYAVDPTKLRSELGWAPAADFAAGLRTTVEWYVEQQSAGVFSPDNLGYARQRLGLGLVTA
jgi:dTDP-glucose 4,6-dehydratase